MNVERWTLEEQDTAAARWPIFRRHNPTLSTQFLATGGLLMLAAMVIAGLLIGEIVSRDVIRNRAASSALFMQSMTGPLVLDLETSSMLSSDAIRRLDGLLSDNASRQRLPHLEIWTPDGTIVYSRAKDLIGRKFKPPESLLRALNGEIAAQYTDLSAGEHISRQFDTPYLEVYSALRSPRTGAVIAVAEIHEQTTPLSTELQEAWIESWAIVAISTTIIMAGLFGIVHRGSRTIADQERALRRRAEEAEEASGQIRKLKDRAERASARIAEMNERSMRSVGADLHDGPSQLLGFVALEIENLRQAKSAKARERVTRLIASTVDEALKEIRDIAKQLLLPDINDLDLEDVIERVVKVHRARTGNPVRVDLTGQPPPLSAAAKICAYRFLQEGLNNAHKHAGGNGLAIGGHVDQSKLQMTVTDDGPAADFVAPVRQVNDTLGLYGLKERIESLGGTLTVTTTAGRGTSLEMWLDLTGGLHFER